MDPTGTNGMGKAGPDKETSSRDKTSPQQAKGDKDKNGRDKGDRDKSDRAMPSRTPSAIATDPSDPSDPTSAAAGETVLDQAGGTSQDGRLPLWVPLGVLVLALLGTAATVVVRRRTGSAG